MCVNKKNEQSRGSEKAASNERLAVDMAARAESKKKVCQSNSATSCRLSLFRFASSLLPSLYRHLPTPVSLEFKTPLRVSLEFKTPLPVSLEPSVAPSDSFNPDIASTLPTCQR